jgi:hypothetical protein
VSRAAGSTFNRFAINSFANADEVLPLSGKENSPCLLRSRSEAVLGETASRGAPNVGEKLL